MDEDENEMTLINFRVTKAQRKRLKLVAVMVGATVTELLTGFIDKLIEEHDGKQ